PDHISSNSGPVTEASTTSLFHRLDQEYYQTVCADLQNLTKEFEKRRDECLNMQKALNNRQEEFVRELSRQKDEMASLRQMLLENSTDIEALCGTVNGLNEWLRQKRTRRTKNHPTSSPRYRAISSSRRQHGTRLHNRNHGSVFYDDDDKEEEGDEAGVLFEEIETWFREWKCFEEEFRSRQQARDAGLFIN
ncbi:hypothetical protein KEM54_003915, partial [Ascosphaera aggregata]